MTSKSIPLSARNFPSARDDAAKQSQADRYAGPESSYRLAFTDEAFLLREELRSVTIAANWRASS